MVADVTNRINRLSLDEEDYEKVKTGIRTLFTAGIDARGATLRPEQKLFRGVSYEEKPTSVDKLGAPPVDLVTGFQRCNGPGNPMFYCAGGIGVVFYELRPKAGDKVYVSKWSIVRNDFHLMYVSHPEHSELSDPVSAIYQFFDTKFMEPIHADFSYRYKITAAITDFFLREGLYDDTSRTIGGVRYTSAAYPGGRADNIAILPAVLAQSMSLDFVEEWVIRSELDSGFEASAVDIASNFDGGEIHWEGRSKQWIVPPKSTCRFVMGPEGWIVLGADGNEIDPT